MAQLQTMGDLLERHASRIAPVALRPPPPPPAPPPEPRPLRTSASAIRRVARGEGYDLMVAGGRAAGVQPSGTGWVVVNVDAGHKATLPAARSADALAARIARLKAMPR
jgi:hypothetical protein